MAFLQRRELSLLLDEADHALGHVCSQWAATDGGESESEVRRSLNENRCTLAEEWLEATSLRVF